MPVALLGSLVSPTASVVPSPLTAVRLQLVVMYMLLGGSAFAALVAAELTVRRLFTPAHQLVKSLRRTAG